MTENKFVKDSAIEDYTYRIFPNDLNSNGTVFGGLIMSILDRLALVVAEKHTGGTCVTVSVDALHFLAPANIEDHLVFKAAVNRVWNSSMEIGLKVLAVNHKSGHTRHVVSAYFTFVNLDELQKPCKINPVIPETDLEKRRYREAQMRRNLRFSHKAEVEKGRKLT